MCNEAVDNCLAALQLIFDYFVASKMIEKLYAALYTNENILYLNEDSGNIAFSCNGMSILNIDLNNINIDNTRNDEVDPDTVIVVRFLAWHIKFENKALKKECNEELMEIASHPERFWNFYMPEISTE